jgi:type VI secretion system protein ImpH
MASPGRGSSTHMTTGSKTDLKSEILKEGHAFSFYQIIRLLGSIQKRTAKNRPSKGGVFEKIRIKPHLSMAFPVSDVEKIEERDDPDSDQLLITANMMGLYGSTSPLPTFYTEELIAEEARDESVSRDFIDIINQRLYELLYRCWIKYRQYLQVIEVQHAPDLERLFCLLGLGEEVLRKEIDDPQSLLRYIGLFSQFPRSALGLKTLLQDALGSIPLKVISCVERNATIDLDQRCCLGVSGCSLGNDAYLGQEIADRMGKFRIQVGPVNEKEFQTFSPGNKAYERLISLTKIYLTEPIEYDLELILAKGQAQTVCLSDADHAMLGVSSLVFSGEYMDEIRTIFTPRLN